MSINNDQKKLLSEMLEQILLNELELESLKLLINDLSNGKSTPKQLKITIIKSRTNAIKRILDIFPFFHKRITSQREIEKFTLEEKIKPNFNSDLKTELDEKDRLLEQIGKRVHTILENLSQ
ncbi:MAG: hypothetical protein ACFFD7_14835 [Candidatus Thorarchaeota archaeon]